MFFVLIAVWQFQHGESSVLIWYWSISLYIFCFKF